MAESFSELPQYELDTAFSDLLPLEFCLEKKVVLLGRRPADASAAVKAGCLNPGDVSLRDELAVNLRRPVTLVQLNPYEVRHALEHVYGLDLKLEEPGVERVQASRRISFAQGQAPRDILGDLLATAIRDGASDIHIESYPGDADLRFRIDGVMRQIQTPLAPDNLARVVSRLKVLCGVDFAEHRHALDGRFTVLFEDGNNSRKVDLRATFLPGPHGLEVALRVLDRKRFILDIDHLGMPAAITKRWKSLIKYPYGLILAVGPTGVGKTTTLYASVEGFRGDNLKVVTVEDPIEYEFLKVNQKNVSKAMGFADWLRTFLRANPDVILVGEIRDAETAEIAIRAATTGHLILSTMHTGDAIAAIGRLRALGVSDDFLSDVLVGILGQRLIRRVCPKCRAPHQPAAELVAQYYEKPPAGGFVMGKGCEACGGSGYSGQLGVFELLTRDPAIEAAIGRGVPVEELRQVALARGWKPLVEDALARAEKGDTTLEEVARKVPPRFGVRN
ncbi:MAG: GspE/PulE family protein [Planctomycetota bacterium]